MPFQKEWCNESRNQNSSGWAKVKQAHIERLMLALALCNARRDGTTRHHGECPAHARQQACETEHDPVARERGHGKRKYGDNRADANGVEHAKSSDRCVRAERTRQITGSVDRVHDAGDRIRPAEAVTHVRQDERIGKATNANSDCRRDRKNHDLPDWRGTDRLILSIRFQDALLSALPLTRSKSAPSLLQPSQPLGNLDLFFRSA